MTMEGGAESSSTEHQHHMAGLTMPEGHMEGHHHNEPVLPPDEEECRALARDMAQVLMSTWLEMLRGDLLKTPLLVLSDHLLPPAPSSAVKRFISLLMTEKSKLPQPLSDALRSFAVNEREAGDIMTTLRTRLFSEPRLV